jgi:hypothetical protein
MTVRFQMRKELVSMKLIAREQSMAERAHGSGKHACVVANGL